jgi:hypothetical protein
MALSSPGVEVKVIDESFYTPAEPGTVPLIVVATAENKSNGAGDGTAPGTLKANAGQVYLLTSQKDLADTFGDPLFKTDANNNPIHAGEQNEYGLQAAYSLLGVSNRAFVVRADLDLTQLNASADAPAADPNNGTYWLDTANTKWGIFEWNGAAASTTGGQTFTNKIPLVITDPTQVDNGTGGPASSVGKNGSYAVVTTRDVSFGDPDLNLHHPLTVWYRNSAGEWVQVGSTDWVASFATAPKLAIQPHTNVPQWKAAALNAVTGSVWIKTTEPNLGSRWRAKRWNSTTESFEEVDAPLYANSTEALFKLDKTGGGTNLAAGQLYVQYNISEVGPVPLADFKIYRRQSAAPTTIKSVKVDATTLDTGLTTFTIAETTKNSAVLSGATTISFTIVAAGAANAAQVAGAINSSMPATSNVVASVDSQNRLVIVHELGGDIHLTDGTNSPLGDLGFIPFNPSASTGAPGSEGNYTTNLYIDDDGDHDLVASLWKQLTYVASSISPTSLTADGTLWYSSVIDEVDIMIHDGTNWVGYQNYPWDGTAPWSMGPIVGATKPELNPDGGALQTGDLWIDTGDLENFPTIYKYNKDLLRWFLVDTSDQSTEDGCLFADARWTDAGIGASFTESTIEELLSSDFLDFDAPDAALYPKGMLLWNLRRSGFNVKQFKLNYIDLESDNTRNNDESMADYYPHRWVTISGNQDDGSGTFGRKAQRKVVVQALQATVNSNQQIRDEEARVFNLIACPGYPELVGELISLNYDRGLTAFVVADTPARLESNATALLNWGTNQQLALEDNDLGLVSSDEYIGFFYPWGFTSDNFGNNVVVPPSHMIMRTIALNDQVAYPWFAPAGVRRGGITNATAVGYVDAEGEFNSVALNVGQRDTMASIKVNPITFITGTGLVNYGQYTRARAASALDRINVARLVVYMRRQLNALAKPYIFEPNDKITRDEIKGAVESLLLELVGQRALYDYLVVCDESNNTPSRIDRNELYIDIAIEPVKAVEFIYIPLRLKNTGEIKGLG